MKNFLVIAAAGGALAIGVPAAFAVTDTPQTPTQPVQQESTPTPTPQQPERERGDDCPEKDGETGAAAAGTQL